MNATKELKRERMYARIRLHGERLKDFFGLPESVEPVQLCKKLRTIERRAHYFAERMCIELVEETEVEKFEEALTLHLTRLLGPGAAPDGDLVFYNHDPRGYALKLTQEASRGWNGYKDWGGYGLIAPEFDGEE